MPKDELFGKDLAERLTGAYTGYIDNVEFTYDSFLELDTLEADKSYCKISPNNYRHVRESRGLWREEISLVLTLVSKVGPTDGEWVSAWLESWDQLIRKLREEPVLNRHTPTSIEPDERYDANMFHNNHRLLTQVTLFYLNVEVI